MHTQVAIIGAGPAGLLLSQRLNLAGISTVVLERKSREYVLSRIRAGVLEWGTVEMLREAKAGARMDIEGFVHSGCHLASNGDMFRLNFHESCGKRVMLYGQTELTRDLYEAQDKLSAHIIHDACDVQLHDIDSKQPTVSWTHNKQSFTLSCDFIAGCDGFHGVSRPSIPSDVLKEFEKVYPFGWLGILSRTPPVSDELIYASHERGFALCSMRNQSLSRYYLQVPLTDKVEDWSDEAFWDELKKRIPSSVANNLVTGPSIEKSIVPLRSYVCEPMRWGSLFLCGDAAHIVPPTGAKGLNLAASDVHYLFEALSGFYRSNDTKGLERYSEVALERVWNAMRFSWSLTTMMHRFPEHNAYERRMQDTELSYLKSSSHAQTVVAKNYTGLPF